MVLTSSVFAISLLAVSQLAQAAEPQVLELPEFKPDEVGALPPRPPVEERKHHFTKKELNKQYIAEHEGEEMPKFAKWLATHNKNYQTMEEYNSRMANWKKHNGMIYERNQVADASGKDDHVRFAHNRWSDAHEHEILARMNYNQVTGRDYHEHRSEEQLADFSDDVDHHGRQLQIVTQGIDWANLGYTGPVEDQGACGSCYSFTSTAALASALSLTTGRYTRLSQQNIIDCSSDEASNQAKFGKTYGNFGCNGGSETKAWDFMKENGVMAWSDYPYSSTTQSTGEATSCQHDNSKIVAKVGSHQVILDSINDMMGQLGRGPLTA